MPKTTFTYTYVGAGVTCTPSFSYTTDYITNFSLGSINNSTGFSTGGYGSYTNLVTDLQAGTTATASLSSSSGSGNHGAAVWIDFNNDGTFSSTERVGTYGNTIQPSTTVQISLSIPSDAAAGRHTLRVVYKYNTAGTSIDPCVSASYGEGEDYTVNIIPGPPTGLAASNITENSAQISWTGQSSSYTVWYGRYEHQTILSQGFEGGSMPSGWSTETGSENGNYWTVATGRNDGNDGGFTGSAHSGSYNAVTYKHSTNSGDVVYLISPAMDLSNATNAKLTCWYMNPNWQSDIDGFGIYYRTSSSGSWNQLLSTSSAHTSWTSSGELSLPSSSFVQLGFKYTDRYGYGYAVDDIVVTADVMSGHEVNASMSPITITGLHPNTTYTVKVKGNNTAYCSPITFTTLPCTLTVQCSPSAGGTATASANGPFDEGEQVTLTATPAEGYVFSYWSKSGTGATLSNTYTNPTTLTVGTSDVTVTANFVAATVFEVGSSQSTSSALPTNVYYGYSLTQQIYYPEEIGHTGSIKCISFYYASSTSFTRNIDVYLSMIGPVNFDDLEFSKNVGTKVFSGPVTFTQGWNTITFSSNFDYSDINRNLMVTVYDYTGSWENSGLNFATYNTDKYCTLYVVNDDDPYDVANPPSPSDVTTAKNYIKLGMTSSTVKNCYNVTAVADPTAAGHLKYSYIGTGTSNGNSTPFASNWGYSFIEQIYPADAIGGAGTIDTIWFYYTSTSAQTNDIVLYMKNVKRGGFKDGNDYEPVSASDIVYMGQWALPTTAGWLAIPLTTPFTYDGTSNLMVAMHEYTSGYSSRNFRYTSTSNSVYYAYSDSVDPDPYDLDSYSGNKGTSSSRANIKLGITYTNSGMSRMYANGTSCTLTASEPASGYIFTDWTESNSPVSTDNPYTFTVNAAHNMVGNFFECVAPTNLAVTTGSINSRGATITWNGTSTSYIVEYAPGIIISEDFNNVSGASSGYNSAGALPTGWDQIYAGTVNNTSAYAPHVHNGSSYPGFGSGANALSGYYLGFYGNNTAGIAIMPALAANQTACHIKFKYKYEHTSYGTLTYGVIDGTDESSYTELGTCSTSSNPGLVDADLDVTLTAGKRIAFRYFYGNSWYTAGIDDLEVTVVQDGSWTTASSSATSPYTFSGLTPNTAYAVRVSNLCGENMITAFTTKPTHTITLAQNPSGSGTVSVTNTSYNNAVVTTGSQVGEGDVLSINVNPHTGWNFINWTWSGAGSSVANASATTTTFTMGTEDATLTANFEQITYTITATANPSAGGTISHTGGTWNGNTGTYNHGSSCTVTATANNGYTFNGWYENNSVVESNTTYTINSVTSNHTLEARFTQDEYTLTLNANPSAGGTVSASPAGPYHYGDVVTITATANPGYTFDSWSDNGAASHTVTMNGNASYTATFTQDEYTLTLNANPSAGGTVSASPAGPYHYGDVVTITATANPGYTFDSWSDNGAASHTVTMNGNASYTATFTHTDFAITYTDDGNGSCTGPATANYGDNVILTVTPNANYEVASVTYNDGSSHTITPVGGVYSFTMPASAVTVNATFVQTAFAITYSPDSNNPSNGCYLSGNSTATAGSNVTVYITEATGYELVSISAIDGNNQTVTLNGSGSTRTFTMPATTVAVSATFQASTYNINIASGITNGSVTTSPSGSAAYGQSVTVNLSPDMGYEVATVTVTNNTTGTAVTTSGSGNTRTFTMPAGDVTVSATFSQISYYITYTYGPNGTCSGVATAHYGETVSVTVTPANNYGLNTLTYTPAGGTAVDITSTQEFTMPANDVAVHATFIQATRYITVTPYPDGTGTVSGGGSYLQGSSCTVTATANPGYSFQYWEENGASVSTSASYTFTVTGDRTLLAHFEQDRTLVTYADPMEGGWVTTDVASTIGAIEVGTGTGSQSYSPFATGAAYSYQQCVYLSSEIGAPAGGCYITSISYQVSSNTNAQNNHIEVFMKHTNVSSFTSGPSESNFIPVTASDKVFDGYWVIPGGSWSGWSTIVLDTPFYYDGTSNLMIGIHENTPQSSNANFISTEEQSIRRRLSVYGNSDMDPLDNTTFTGLTMQSGKQRANVRLGFGTYANGQTVTLTAHPSTDYAFEGWYENNALVSSNATYAVAIDADHSLTARFVPPVFTRFITGHQGGSGYWYLIASPLASPVSPTNVTGMISDNYDYTVNPALAEYDLYWFDRTQTLEWRNYRLSAFNLVNGQGYLYASKQDVTLTFRGIPYRGNGSFPLTEDNTNTDPVMHKLNLMGNPFPEAVTASVPYYAMNNGGTEISIQSSNATIPAMEGVFMQYNAQNATNVTFTPVSKGRGIERDELLVLELFNDGENDVIDRAIVNFSRNFMVRKAQLNPNHTKVYLPVGGLDYAMIHSATDVDEIPVSFKAERNGVYTFGVSAEEVGFTYLHLIDNLTGADVDLLNNPTYTFEARTTDYATRFRLVFAAGETTQDIFGFYNNGSWVINNDGEATVQVIDVLGRILKSQSIDGCANIYFKAAPGVYMLRLIKGNEMKVQKVVVHQQY